MQAERALKDTQLANVTAAHAEALRVGEQLNAKLQSTQASFAVLESALRHEVDDLKAEVARCNSECRTQAEAINVFVADKAAREQALARAQQDRAEALKLNEQLALAQRAVLAQIEAQARQDVDDAHRATAEAVAELDALKAAHAAAHKLLVGAQQSAEEAKRTQTLAQGRLEIVESALAEQERRAHELADLLGQRNDAAERLQRQMDEALADTRAMRRERDDVRSELGAEMDTLRKDLKAKEARCRELEQMLSSRDMASERLELLADEEKRALDTARRELDAVRSKLGAQVDSLSTALKVANLEAEDKDLTIAGLTHAESELKLALQRSELARQDATDRLVKLVEAGRAAEGDLRDTAGLYERLLVALSIGMPLAAWANRRAKL